MGKPVQFVLLPGAGGSSWYWHLVAPRLRNHGHNVTAVDLPAADDTAGLPEYAAAVVKALGDPLPDRIVLVAQSLGAFTVPIVCERVSVAVLVFVNGMIPKPGETAGDWWANTGQAEAKKRRNVLDGRNEDAPFDPRLDFFHDVPAALTEAALEQGQPEQSSAVFASPCNFKAWPRVPTHVLVGRDDRFFPASFQRRVAQERLGIDAEEMPGGHLIALSQPDALTGRLLTFAAEAA